MGILTEQHLKTSFLFSALLCTLLAHWFDGHKPDVLETLSRQITTESEDFASSLNANDMLCVLDLLEKQKQRQDLLYIHGLSFHQRQYYSGRAKNHFNEVSLCD